MKKYGCIGKRLTHSFSKEIHARLADYAYELIELTEQEIQPFLERKDFEAINVTIPYKQTVIPYLDEVSEQAAKIGAVNTVVNRAGQLYGYNTDYFGMRDLLIRNGTDPAGRKVLILGTGATSKTAYAVVSDLGAAEIRKVSRTGKEGALTYEEACTEHTDADIIINTTPCGMYPDIDDSPINLDCFPGLCGLVDAIYNPLRTPLVLQAQKRGIPAEGGLYMLVVQAVYAAELFTGRKIDPAAAEQIYKDILNSKRNIVLTGMSLAGKTTLGTLLSQRLGRRLEDTDDLIIEREQRPITEIFAVDGEPYFRDVETAMVRELAPQNGIIISTGGGVILREENVDALKKNGYIIFLDRPLDQILPADDRPLANTKEKVVALMKKRYPIYRSTCDDFIPNDISPEDGAEKILAALQRA
jgi:shikimate dehydrogenase